MAIGHKVFSKDSSNLYDKLDEYCCVIYEFNAAVADKRADDDLQLHIYIEEAAKMFSSASTAHVMSLLQRWNGMVCAATYITLGGLRPNLIGALSARSKIGIKISRGLKKKESKDVILNHIKCLKIIPDGVWETKRTGRPKDHCYDMADAYVVARAGFLNGSDTIP